MASKKLSNSTDLQELLVRRSMMDQTWSQAVDEARKLVSSREEEMDYEAMRRALLLEARALQAACQQGAADDVMRRFTDSEKAQATQ